MPVCLDCEVKTRGWRYDSAGGDLRDRLEEGITEDGLVGSLEVSDKQLFDQIRRLLNGSRAKEIRVLAAQKRPETNFAKRLFPAIVEVFEALSD